MRAAWGGVQGEEKEQDKLIVVVDVEYHISSLPRVYHENEDSGKVFPTSFFFAAHHISCILLKFFHTGIAGNVLPSLRAYTSTTLAIHASSCSSRVLGKSQTISNLQFTHFVAAQCTARSIPSAILALLQTTRFF